MKGYFTCFVTNQIQFSFKILSLVQMSVYAAQFVHDLNGDGTPEILAVHGGDELSDPGKFL
jgi:hypothetical protein